MAGDAPGDFQGLGRRGDLQTERTGHGLSLALAAAFVRGFFLASFAEPCASHDSA
jgi:hypothetical protein